MSGNHSQSKSNIEDLSQPLEIRVKSDSGFLCAFFKKGRKADVRWTSALRRPKRIGDRELWKNNYECAGIIRTDGHISSESI